MHALLKKLNFKAAPEIYVLNAPKSFDKVIAEFSLETTVIREFSTRTTIAFVMVFVQSEEEIAKYAATIFPSLLADGIVWFCYPKASSKQYKSEISRDTGWKVLGTYDVEPVRSVAIDEDWSGVRFRQVAFIKKITRNPVHRLSGKG